MRVEPFGVGSYVHILKRGARGLPIVRDEADRVRFMRLLYYLNDDYRSEFWEQSVRKLGTFERPNTWPRREPLVKIVAWTLMPNHFHLLIQEIQEGGVSRFMQSLCGSISRHFNEKYNERGSIFQGPYRAKTVNNDAYLRWVASYILVKNVFELYPGGYDRAVTEFERAWRWGIEKYSFSSLNNAALFKTSPIIDQASITELFASPEEFKKLSRDMILGRTKIPNEFIALE